MKFEQICSRKRSNRWIKAIFRVLFAAIACWLVLSQSLTTQAKLPYNSCPADIKILTDRLIEDLPGYANRVIQRARNLDRVDYLSTYVILAGRPEFESLPLTSRQYAPVLPDTSQQVFFTTLERRYSQNKLVRAQNYHWLFLTQAQDGWRLVTIYTQFGSPEGDGSRPPTPPQETSDGVIGQAVRLWLRDCRALD